MQKFEQLHYKHYDLIIVAFVLCLLISNLAATKLVSVGSLILDGGAILFPITYILDDILTEVYGYKYARRAIWAGFGGMLLAILCFTAVRYLPYPHEYTDQHAYETVLGFFPRIVLASLTAYLIGEFLNSFVLAKLKIKTRGRYLWLRLVTSTMAGELFDTLIFCLVAFGGILQGWDMVNYIVVGWVFKVGVEVVLLPVTYRVVNWLKRVEGVDNYDRTTKFTPFHISIDE